MNIAAMNIKITFQKNTQVVDRYCNRKNEWQDYHTCHATATHPTTPPASSMEADGAATTIVQETLDFTTRYSSELSAVTSDGYRIIAKGQVYNILFVNPMNYRNKCLKFHCRRERA